MLLHFFTLRVVPSGLVARYVALMVLTGLVVTHWLYWWPERATDSRPGPEVETLDWSDLSIKYGGVQSPIRELMINASTRFDHLVAQRAGDMWAASGRYRIRRGRHPPPGFDKWVEAAVESNAVIVEEFFDRIYKDLTPFWGLDPRILRERANTWHWVLRIRNGETAAYVPFWKDANRLDEWATLVREFSMHMPDVDIPLNIDDAARLLVPFWEINRLVQEESEKRKLMPLAEVTREFMDLSAFDKQVRTVYEPKWMPPDSNYWDTAAGTCRPGSAMSRTVQTAQDTSSNGVPPNWKPRYAFQGFIQNWTAATDVCEQPHLRQMRRAFAHAKTTEELFPVFSGSKLSINNDILLPGPMYLNNDENRIDGEALRGAWAAKDGKVFWRGDADRLLKLLDGDLVSRLEAGEQDATLTLPSQDIYASRRREQRELGTWLTAIVDSNSGKSPPLKAQVKHRFLPDVDGDVASPRFRSLLRSTSLPIKSTLFTEWHDDRLVPWMHFVPLDYTLQDLHAVLEFFADGSGAGNTAARFIAERGAEWAEKTLRREDMKLYVWRLLLEWARIVDDNRETLAFTGDVMEHPD